MIKFFLRTTKTTTITPPAQLQQNRLVLVPRHIEYYTKIIYTDTHKYSVYSQCVCSVLYCTILHWSDYIGHRCAHILSKILQVYGECSTCIGLFIIILRIDSNIHDAFCAHTNSAKALYLAIYVCFCFVYLVCVCVCVYFSLRLWEHYVIAGYRLLRLLLLSQFILQHNPIVLVWPFKVTINTHTHTGSTYISYTHTPTDTCTQTLTPLNLDSCTQFSHAV